MKKIKVFLGGVVNLSNAQNNNCYSLYKSLSTDKFDCRVLQSKKAALLDEAVNDSYLINKPIAIFKYISFAKGIIWSDVAYLPKTECVVWNRMLCKFFRKKHFRTVESIIDPSAISKGVINGYRKTDVLYSITSFMKDYNFRNHDVRSENEILYLGVHSLKFKSIEKEQCEGKKSEGKLKNIIIIGHDLKRKGLRDYLYIASQFSYLNFHVVGSGNGKIDVEHEIASLNLANVKYHGSKTSSEVIEVLREKKIDLLVLPSRVEGFPKVILECASLSIPAVLYSDYGAREWISHRKNGFVCDTREQMIGEISQLQNDYNLLKSVKLNARALADNFDWSVKVKSWEKVIEKLYE